ncbi:MAG: DUF1501 domain-containing protein [Pseudomonadota bacterium]
MSRRNLSRRRFLQAATGLVACGGTQALLPQLDLLGTALAGTTTSDYRALVCVFLAGGNDSWNMLLPADSERHAIYTATRNGLYNGVSNTSGLAVPRPGDPNTVPGQTLPEALALTGTDLAVNPFMPEVAQLFDEGSLAFTANVGTLIEPVTRADFNGRATPPQLFSHNDQSDLWRAGTGDGSVVSEGWGGRIAGSVALPSTQTAGLPPAISISGQTRFLVGTASNGAPIVPYTLTTSDTQPAAALAFYGADNPPGQFQPARRAALEELLAASSEHLFAGGYRDVLGRAIDLAETVVNPSILAIPADDPVNGGGDTGFDWPDSNIAAQLQQVARMIRISRPGTGPSVPIDANRQVFYVTLGGFDTHAAQITSASNATGHHALLEQLSQGVNAFQRAMEALGITDEVTLFSMSDFARTLNSNGNGTDHAWGSVQFAVGGAVNGGQVYGRYPSVTLDNAIGGAGAISPDLGESLSRGQFLPTTAVDQYAATFARWMGVADADLPAIFPNIDNFVSGPFADAAVTPTFASFTRTVPGLVAGV